MHLTRSLAACTVAVVAMVFSTAALADCLGTSRTIRVDANEARFYNGLERSLGLRDKEVILTFDDGPVPGKTTRILDALRDECARATFFMSGRMAKAYPTIAQRVLREGHTVAGHTFDHANLVKSSTASAASNIDRGNAAIKAATGMGSVEFFRYPYLAKNARTDRIVARKGLIAFGANIDSKDYFKVAPAAVRERTMARLRRQGRGIILMHDIHTRTASMLPGLLDQLKAEGYRIVHMVPGRSAPASGSSATEAPVVNASVVARAKPERTREKPIAVVAYAAEPTTPGTDRRVLPLDLLARTGNTRVATLKVSVAERLRTQRTVNRTFRPISTGFPTDHQGVIVQLRRR